MFRPPLSVNVVPLSPTFNLNRYCSQLMRITVEYFRLEGWRFWARLSNPKETSGKSPPVISLSLKSCVTPPIQRLWGQGTVDNPDCSPKAQLRRFKALFYVRSCFDCAQPYICVEFLTNSLGCDFLGCILRPH